MVSVPTTYSGSEWTDSSACATAAGGCGAAVPEPTLTGVLYEPELTFGLPRGETVGTALNALAHSAEAFYVKGRSGRGDRHAFSGARPISYALPLCRRSQKPVCADAAAGGRDALGYGAG